MRMSRALGPGPLAKGSRFRRVLKAKTGAGPLGHASDWAPLRFSWGIGGITGTPAGPSLSLRVTG